MRSPFNNSGFFTPLAIVLTMFIAGILVALAIRTRHLAHAFQAEKIRQERVVELEQALIVQLMQKDGAAVERASSSKITLTELPVNIYQMPISQLKTEKTLAGFTAAKSYFLSYPAQSPIPGGDPDWDLLASHSNGPALSCLLLSKAPFPNHPYKSLYTCFAPQQGISENINVKGNLFGDKGLQFSNLKDSRIYLSVQGALNIRNKLLLNNLHNVRVEIISTADIEIESIDQNLSTEVSLLLHSSRGSVTVSSLAPDISYCQNPSPTPITSMRIEAKNTIRLGSQEFNPSSALGCPYDRDPLFWPKIRILGEANS